ncbi:MAG: hypothetical protein WC969_03500 [Elusimicrobiota bacterium]|jgi:hypothetical protein
MRPLLLVAVAVVAMAYSARNASPLEGTAWEVQVKSDALFSCRRKDTLIFKDGLLTVASCAAEGVAPSSYGSEREGAGGAASWQAALHREGRGTWQWQGVMRGDAVEGSVLRTLPDGKVRRYRFTGTRRED